MLTGSWASLVQPSGKTERISTELANRSIPGNGSSECNRTVLASTMIDRSSHWADALVQRYLATSEVVLMHFGGLDHGRLEELLAQAETFSERALDGVAVRKRLFNVLVEGMENVHRHTAADHAASAFAALFRSPDGYHLLFGNALPAASAASMAHRVEVLNQMDEADLREHHLRLLTNEGRTERGGAGLGLLTIARTTNGAIKVHALPGHSNTVHLALEVQLNLERGQATRSA